MAKKTNKFANTTSEETVAPVAEVKAEEAAKPAAEAAEAPKAEAKTEKPAAKKPAAKKAADKPAAKKAADKPAAKAEKPAAKKASDKASKVVIQFAGKEFDSEELVEKCKAAYKGDSRKQVKTIDVYVKPEESRAYYVVNGKAEEGSFIEL